ncbi:hypothetical protein J4231_01645 [Candidatus Woesearchaeota archaeon]|nr:hypothetical protein [Candidatus Woesearchaeota archaeon]
MFKKKEISHLVISIVVLGFAFGFNDKQPTFNLANWTFNFFRAFIAAAITLLLYELVHKFVASRYGSETEYEIWSIKRYWFTPYAAFPKKIFGKYTINSIPLGIIISLFTTLITNGLFYIIPLSSFKAIEKTHLRVVSKFKHLTYFEEAKIASASIILLTIMAIILTSFGKSSTFTMLSTMLFVFVLYSMIPVSTLDGSKIFFGSLALYLAVFAFIVLSYLLVDKFGAVFSIFLALLGSAFVVLIYLHKS